MPFLPKPFSGVSDYEKPREGTITMLTKHSEGVNPLREAHHEYTKLLTPELTPESGDKVQAIDPSKLPSGSVNIDDVPAGQVNLEGLTPDQVRAAFIPQSPDHPLEILGLKAMEDGVSYKLPN